MAAILAIGTSFFWGLFFLITRIGLRRSNALSALLITMIICLLTSLVISLFAVPVRLFASRASLHFIGAGFMGPFIARFLLYIGIDRLGASITAPLSNLKPMFAAIIAMLILGEELTFSIALGTFLIIAGAAAISTEQSGGQIEKKWAKRDLVFPISAGACIGIAQVLRKVGLDITPAPLVGVTIQNAAALAFFPFLVLARGNGQRLALNDMRAWILFSLAGLSAFSAQLCVFYALEMGQVVIVSPLSSLSPLFVLILVGIFLRKLERVTWKIVLGSFFIVAGTAFLTIFSRV